MHEAASSIRLSTVPLKASSCLKLFGLQQLLANTEEIASFRTTVQRMCFARAANFNLAKPIAGLPFSIYRTILGQGAWTRSRRGTAAKARRLRREPFESVGVGCR